MFLASRWAFRAALAFVFTTGAFVPLPAQDGTVFRAGSRLVVLHVTVVDGAGRLVNDLPSKAFSVFEDNQPQQIKLFRHEDTPVSMGIVIDNSGSMSPKRVRVEDAARGLVKASNPDDEVFVVNFNEEPSLDVDFTNDFAELATGVARIDSSGGTAMRDAIDLAMDHLNRRAKRDRKVLVVVTDGNDNASSVDMGPLIKKAQKSGVLIYTVGLLSEENADDARAARHALNQLAETTGGQAFYANRVQDVETFSLEAAHEIRSQYTIGYSPTNTAFNGGFRRVMVRIGETAGATHERITGLPNIRAEWDRPVSMGVLIDNSGSMREKRGIVADAALELLEASGADDEICIINFNDEVSLDVEFTHDVKTLHDAIARVDSSGATAMRDAIDLAIDHLESKARNRKMMVVVTDGNDNASDVPLSALIRKARRSSVVVYAIGLLSEESKADAASARHALDALAQATGGEAFYPARNEELRESFRKMRTLRAITRSGYYATPDLDGFPQDSGGSEQLKKGG